MIQPASSLSSCRLMRLYKHPRFIPLIPDPGVSGRSGWVRPVPDHVQNPTGGTQARRSWVGSTSAKERQPGGHPVCSTSTATGKRRHLVAQTKYSDYHDEGEPSVSEYAASRERTWNGWIPGPDSTETTETHIPKGLLGPSSPRSIDSSSHHHPLFLPSLYKTKDFNGTIRIDESGFEPSQPPLFSV